MADLGKVRVRTCAAETCTVRLSSIEKDEHVLCPIHTGWQCSFDTRCDICRNWSDVKMKEYLKLQAGKARRKVYKEKKKAEKLAAGETSAEGHAHSLSPSSLSSSQDISGETVPSPVLSNPKSVNKAVNITNLFNFGAGSSRIFCLPPVLPLPL